MNYARMYSWNPFRFNQFAYQGEEAGGSAPPTGGSAPPASTPAPSGEGASSPAPGAGDGSSSGASDDPFAGMDGDLDIIDLGIGDQGDGTEPAPNAPTTPQVTPPVEPKPTVAPVATPPAATPPAQEPAATAPSGPRSAREDLDDAVNGFKNNFNELVNWAQTDLFALTPEETEALNTDAVSVIPKLMARAYTQAIMASANIMRNFAPRMIQEGFAQQAQSTARAAEASKAFWDANPHLSQQEHGAAMAQWAKMFRQMNPKASRADAIKFVGDAVTTQFGLTRAPTKPGAQQQRQVPFQPARPGGRQPEPAPQNDPYGGLDVDFLDSE